MQLKRQNELIQQLLDELQMIRAKSSAASIERPKDLGKGRMP